MNKNAKALKLGAVFMCLGCISMPGLTHEDAAEENKGPWSGDYALGYLSSSGNTEDSSASFDFKTGYDLEVWHHLLKGKTFSSSTDNDSTAENYQLGWKSIYDLDPKNYVFGALDWNKDRFSSYTRQTYATAGYGRRILDSKRFILNLEIGAGYSKQRAIISETEFETLKENQDGSVGSLGGIFVWNISDNAAFEQSLNIFYSSDNTRTESVSSIKAGLIGNVGLVLSYTVKNNSDVAPDIEKTDTYTSIALNYAFL
jgi:putative salt-induced outer membrane protein